MPSYDPTDLRSQENAKAEDEKRQRLAQASEEKDFTWLMSSKQGRRIVWRLLQDAGVFRISFHQNSMQMAFNEGARNYGNRVLERINLLCPELWPTMIKENANGRNEAGSADHTN